MNILKKHWLIIAIIIFAAFLRLWKLGSIPPSLTQDEAALGYNAFSILRTGRDEYGKLFPLIFKSFGDYKPGLYVYLDIPFVAALGLNEVSTRLPSALSGVLSVILIYFIVKNLFTNHKSLATISAFVAATNPYLIYFSRAAWEANVALCLTLGALLLFIKSLKNNKLIILSAVLFSLTLVTYQGAKLSTAVVVLILILIYWREFWKVNIKYLFTSLVLGVFIALPVFSSFFNGQTERLVIYSIFSYPRPQSETSLYAGKYFYLFHSDQLNYLRMFLSRYFNFYSGRFLFFIGDSENMINTAPYQGILQLVDVVLLPLGLFALIRKKISKSEVFIFAWIILSPLSAALTRDQTNAVRSLNAAVPLIFIIAFGLKSILIWIASRKYRLPYHILLTTFYIFSFTYFLDAYFIHVPAHNSNVWRYGYKQAVQYVTPVQKNYKNIVFEQSFMQPYIYFLYYQKYNPQKYQLAAKLVDSEYKGDVGYVQKLDNINFEKLDWSVLKKQHGVLVIGNINSFPPKGSEDSKDYMILHEIKFLNGRDVAFEIAEII